MANTASVVSSYALGRTAGLHVVKLTVTGTYATGGEAISIPKVERVKAMLPAGGQSGYVAGFDYANQKMKLYQDNGTATAAALPEVANGANHTALSGSTWIVIGK